MTGLGVGEGCIVVECPVAMSGHLCLEIQLGEKAFWMPVYVCVLWLLPISNPTLIGSFTLKPGLDRF